MICTIFLEMMMMRTIKIVFLCDFVSGGYWFRVNVELYLVEHLNLMKFKLRSILNNSEIYYLVLCFI